MIRNSLLLFLSVIFTCEFFKHVSALYAEDIVNGALADKVKFKYQAAILVRHRSGPERKLECSGAVVAKTWILSVAHCFMLNSLQPKELIFTAILSANDLTAAANAIYRNIIFIYTNGYNADDYTNDITMAKTGVELVIGFKIQPIPIPDDGESFLDSTGVLSGYGCFDVLIGARYNVSNNFVQYITEPKLRTTNVTVTGSFECFQNFLNFYTIDKFCGIAIHIEGKYTGTCWDDAGSPLVIDNQVVGLASVSNKNCDDTIHGSLYTEVSKYSSFIENVIKGKRMDSWLQHILDPRFLS